MNLSTWIDAKTACALLGVKPQTLYAYVSRSGLRVKADPEDSRRSLYLQADIETLARQNLRPRARVEVAEQTIRWGDPILVTAISEVRDGTLWLRGRSVSDCADTMTFEELTAFLCEAETIDCPTVPVPDTGNTAIGRAMSFLSLEAETSSPMQFRNAEDIAAEVGHLISGITNALLGRTLAGPIHQRLASSWSLQPEATDQVRRALVILGDHELNPSTFAVRVCASTGASLPASILAGLSTLSGPRHGGVAGSARAALLAAGNGDLESFLASRVGQSPYSYGFGHPLYPDGDPRARLILGRLPQESMPLIGQRGLSARLNLPPNVDVGLAALALCHGCPEEAASTIFTVGRLAGWIAHAIEQVQSGQLIRPRARYESQVG